MNNWTDERIDSEIDALRPVRGRVLRDDVRMLLRGLRNDMQAEIDRLQSAESPASYLARLSKYRSTLDVFNEYPAPKLTSVTLVGTLTEAGGLKPYTCITVRSAFVSGECEFRIPALPEQVQQFSAHLQKRVQVTVIVLTDGTEHECVGAMLKSFDLERENELD